MAGAAPAVGTCRSVMAPAERNERARLVTRRAVGAGGRGPQVRRAVWRACHTRGGNATRWSDSKLLCDSYLCAVSRPGAVARALLTEGAQTTRHLNGSKLYPGRLGFLSRQRGLPTGGRRDRGRGPGRALQSQEGDRKSVV